MAESQDNICLGEMHLGLCIKSILDLIRNDTLKSDIRPVRATEMSRFSTTANTRR